MFFIEYESYGGKFRHNYLSPDVVKINDAIKTIKDQSDLGKPRTQHVAKHFSTYWPVTRIRHRDKNGHKTTILYLARNNTSDSFQQKQKSLIHISNGIFMPKAMLRKSTTKNKKNDKNNTI